jgi:hypothetical protein
MYAIYIYIYIYILEVIKQENTVDKNWFFDLGPLLQQQKEYLSIILIYGEYSLQFPFVIVQVHLQ